MMEHVLEKLFEHNNWGNFQVLQACSSLTPRAARRFVCFRYQGDYPRDSAPHRGCPGGLPL
jgi:hypothetical protein